MKDLKWGDPVNGWHLSASLDKTVFNIEEPIIVTIVFQNIADQEQYFGGHGRDFDYTLDCRNEQGEKIPLTLYGERMRENMDSFKTVRGVVQPKDQIVVELSITRHLDLSIPGKYNLTLSRKVFEYNSPNEPPIVSNTIKFEIVEK